MSASAIGQLVGYVLAIAVSAYGAYHARRANKQTSNPPATVNTPNGGSKTAS